MTAFEAEDTGSTPFIATLIYSIMAIMTGSEPVDNGSIPFKSSNKKKMKANIGNIIKLKTGSIVIVSKTTSDLTYWVSFDSENCSGVTKNKSCIENSMCWTCDINAGGSPGYDCKDCKGTGYYDENVPGIDKSILLATNVKEYIIKSLTKNFNL